MTLEQIEVEWGKWSKGQNERMPEVLFMFAQHIAMLERAALIAEIDELLKPSSEWVGNMNNVYINYDALKAILYKWRTK